MICDTGAQVNLLSETVCRQLKLVRQSTNADIFGINDTMIETKGQVVLELWHRSYERIIVSSKFVIINNFELYHPQESFSHLGFSDIDKDQFADPHYNVQGRVDGIIGVNILAAHLQYGIVRNPLGLLAQLTSFGWIVFGGPSMEEGSDTLQTVNLVSANDVYAQIKKLWEIEERDERPIMAQEDQACETLYQSTVVKSHDRYSVTLLLKPKAELGESRSMAKRRLFCLESRLRKNPEMRENYLQFMEEYERLGHMRRADPLEPAVMNYYIPHHAVSIDRKFRVVFDASAKTTNGRSLNEVQYVGPRLQRDLMDIVMNFRTGQYAITSDICKMYRQIEVQQKYWDLQRNLWRKSPNEPISEYWLTVVTYGMSSSPYNAVKTLNQCATDNSAEFPWAAQVAKDDFYMDDLLTSVETDTQASDLKKELIALLRKGGFELAKWRSNCESIMEEQMDAKVVTEQGSTSVLGIAWNYGSDEFQFDVKERPQPDEITKRIITGEAARIFDPQGYVTPITVSCSSKSYGVQEAIGMNRWPWKSKTNGRTSMLNSKRSIKSKSRDGWARPRTPRFKYTCIVMQAAKHTAL